MLNGTKDSDNGLFSEMEESFIIPLVYVKREVHMTND